MKKDKMGQKETILVGMFPQCFPTPEISGETKQEQEGAKPDLQPMLDEVWEWLGNPDEY